MKRKNILKFVSLLGIGSFVMLAAASCTQASTPTPTPTPNPEPKPDPMPNPPSGGMNGGNTNPGGGQNMMDAAAQELTAAKKVLSDLIGEESKTVELYADYAKIKADLTSAYAVAKTTSDSSTSTLDQVKTATSTLQTAIDAAVKARTDFDAVNGPLVAAYNALKETLKNEKSNLDLVMAAEFAAIKNNLDSLYQTAKTLVEGTLQPKMENSPQVEAVNQANQAIVDATRMLETRKNNASTLNTSFLKETLKSASLSAATGDNATTVQQQPGDYSFVAYASDITSPNWNFAQRTVWTADTKLVTSPLPNNSQNSAPLTDVSWIYSLTRTDAKYTLTFNYYGPDTAYLYFPYKLVKGADKNNIGLQYKLNDGNFEQINFAPTQPVESESESAATEPARSTMPQSARENQTSEENMTAASQLNPTLTVSDINVAKVTLSNLKFGSNTIEFSVPTQAEDEMPKVAPMIGNMYLTSSDSDVNKNKIYDDLFGNNSVQQDNKTAVTVDLLKGYSLATSWRTYIRQFTGLTGNGAQTSDPVYLIGLIGGSGNRTVASAQMNKKNNPHVNGDTRTFTIHVNAPVNGNYHISGAYLQGSTSARSLKFSTGEMAQNVVTVTNLKQDNWTTLGHFDTKMTSTTVSGTDGQMKKTLNLNKGLNKIILSGVSNRDTPFIGNLTFTLESNQTTGE
ncbi:VlhA.5.07 variable lipoprotein family protein [Mycoplasmoides gallisepticum str. R(low)]|uniref:VlhA.5.07 variable lipoprotein family protein n=1 Tax=Mycoplasmoides gallisepticum (strain R(low / passage 15 / clone 2)) TaxID=710127 RepID=Q7NBD7_MYCGA|nr:FIVAR domain-containing protein [Mycoplasmoides gallisepticum]AAP56692.1 VlhA.5.07 variable lipoprotein family protein [Mycoplasmoides gallisepticum str. R(low)]ADC30542.1 VlhA.5.07 variable lipoprotein family protein [Mycoplasmoides gallisepticum str. R(high)]